jgi:hypothetical protein
VYAAFRGTGTIFCSCSGPGLPDELVRTADDVYLRLHGPRSVGIGTGQRSAKAQLIGQRGASAHAG